MNKTDLITNLTQSFMSQELVGFIFLGITSLFIITCIRYSLKISAEYRKLTKSFKNSEKISIDGKEELQITNEVLNLIVRDFKESASKGTENINTEVIIQKRLDDEIKVFKKERMVKSIPSVCIALGLLGTFLGLTLAIIQTKGVLAGSFASTSDFANAMEGPFVSMSSAFWTSIFGVFASVLLNSINIKLENEKEKFYDEIEDYLDNTIYSLYSVNFISQFNDFNNLISSRMMNLNAIVKDSMIECNTILKDSMLNLTGEMKNLFQDGINELVNKINKNTIDLTDTLKGLTNYTKDLERLTNSLDVSVKNFKEPVDIFKSSIHEFMQTSEHTTNTMKQSINKFSVKVDLLEESLNKVESTITGNKNELEKIGSSVSQKLESNFKLVHNSFEKFKDTTELISKNQNQNQEDLKQQIENLNKGYENFNNLLSGFVINLEKIQMHLVNEISNKLTTEFKNMSEGIVNKLDTSISLLAQSTEKLKEDSSDIGRLVRETNDLYKVRKDPKEKVKNDLDIVFDKEIKYSEQSLEQSNEKYITADI